MGLCGRESLDLENVLELHLVGLFSALLPAVACCFFFGDSLGSCSRASDPLTVGRAHQGRFYMGRFAEPHIFMFLTDSRAVALPQYFVPAVGNSSSQQQQKLKKKKQQQKN
jgi:hypothetical protein